MNNAVAVAYEKEDLSQVNPQLHKWLAIVNDKSSVEEASQVNPRLHDWPTTINEKSSTTIITKNSNLSTPKTDFRAKEQTADDFSNLLASAGIDGKALEIRGDLAELYRIANEADEDGAVKRGLRDSKTGREILVRFCVYTSIAIPSSARTTSCGYSDCAAVVQPSGSASMSRP